ncbi:MAG: glutamine-hydrolyzing GMP synthase [Candidatus Latescibacteria bacterium]|nr:glutamine-hydrolyzing GMP synthase [Candidatus Latescibacterota bacterium]
MEVENKISVIDFGGQYAHLITKRVRHLGVYADIIHPDISVEELGHPGGIILSGGPSSVYSEDAPPFNKELLDTGIPTLGLCYGMQLMAYLLNGEVRRLTRREYGRAELTVIQESPLFKRIGKREQVWMSHGDSVVNPPEGFSVTGKSDDCPVAAIADERRRMYGLQFHPEVKDTPCGDTILQNFISLCSLEKNWSMESYIEEKMNEIRVRVGNRNVFLLVSGGVDSTVTFTLLNEALGEDRVLGLHIDNGCMRKNESEGVKTALDKLGFHNLHIVDRTDDFLRAVEGITDPQEKRKAIGDEFIYVKDRELEALDLDPDGWLLGQGTLYPDIIESGGSRHADVIKTHHNRTDMIKEMVAKGLVVEPLDQLYKDEVREVGERLGLPHDLVWRHPFPGPGLGVRVLCGNGNESTTDYSSIGLQVEQKTRKSGYNSLVIPVKSVGVQGDSRTYAHPAAVEGELDWEKLELLSTDITNEIDGINRVIYKIGGGVLKPLQSKPATLTKDRLNLIREADYLAMQVLREHRLYEQIFQMPVVLIPVSTDGEKECVVIRPLESSDVMTARFYRMPKESVREIAGRILALGQIDYVFYDVTNKPPGTFEWE